MPTLDPRGRNITRAINGPVATYAIDRHDRLYLDVLGGGRASWRIRYRPKPNANQRWFTLSDDARNADFEKIATKAHDLLTDLRLHGIDPLTEQEKKDAPQPTLTEVFKLWLDHTGKRRAKSLSPATRKGYEDLYDLHVKAHLAKKR